MGGLQGNQLRLGQKIQTAEIVSLRKHTSVQLHHGFDYIEEFYVLIMQSSEGQ